VPSQATDCSTVSCARGGSTGSAAAGLSRVAALRHFPARGCGMRSMELPPPLKLKQFDRGWESDDTKTFDKDRGREGDTHTHTYFFF
jgi:hypothetical protein